MSDICALACACSSTGSILSGLHPGNISARPFGPLASREVGLASHALVDIEHPVFKGGGIKIFGVFVIETNRPTRRAHDYIDLLPRHVELEPIGTYIHILIDGLIAKTHRALSEHPARRGLRRPGR